MSTTEVAKGLEGVAVAETALSEVMGEVGRLIYAGYDIQNIAGFATFEEVAFLLFHGHLPNQSELSSFLSRLAAYRALPNACVDTIRLIASTEPMDVLRTAASALGAAHRFTGPAS